MDQKERRALDKCFDGFLRDLDPSTSFIHSLYAEGVLTEEQMDRISKISSRETQVAMLIRFLPHRGPNAFTVFKDKLEKDYPWLAQRLADELKKLQSGQASINKRLVTTIETKLVPLVYSGGAGFDMCDEKAHPGVIIEKLGDLLNSLELKCHKALDITAIGKHKTPIHKLIEDRLRQEKRKEGNEDVDDLNKEVKDLKRQVREMTKLKSENEKLKTVISRQKEKLKDYNKMSRDSKRHKQDMEKFKKETEMLRYEVETLREQLRSNISNPYA
ncbi:uncharacterized protein LOC132727813 [Ruditapes philippinarum]|uniref:uncharacterized protein LOC132727813 n=1 Tax=Ruditapes philippinarum TaxID=129788 RepID=UPI00295C1587|nr:uncharacterized protein LOC132727813 [Ruditapes philippinarum]